MMMHTTPVVERGWDAVAEAWDRHAGYVDDRLGALSAALLERAAIRSGDRVLELACGPGGLGLAAAALEPGAEVVLTDASPGMVEVAERRARERGLDGVATRVLDLAGLDEPDASYDVVLCREGLMFAPDTAATLRDVHRVLRPGGRVACSVWGAREENPWLGALFEAVRDIAGPEAAPGPSRGPFALGAPEPFVALLAGAGFGRLRVDRLAVPARVGDFEEWWARTMELSAPLAALRATLPAERIEAIRDRARERTARYATPRGLELPGVAVVASGVRRGATG